MRPRELIAQVASYYPSPYDVQAVIKRLGIEKIADRPYGKLSGGQKRQAQFAMAIAGRPELLFLDEPTVGLDVQAREALWQVLRDLIHEGCSIVLTTHYIEEAEALADRVAVVTHGRLVAGGTVDEVRAHVTRKTSCAAPPCRSRPCGPGPRCRKSARIPVASRSSRATPNRCCASCSARTPMSATSR